MLEPHKEINRETYIAIDKFRKLGISDIVVVDDNLANTQASKAIQVTIEKAGLKFTTFNSVEEFKIGISSLNASMHTLVLSDFSMPSERKFLGRKNAGGIAVIDICIENEKQGQLNYPIILSHTGQGHTGQMVDICYGNGNFKIDDIYDGKADPKFWEKAMQLLAVELTRDRSFWSTRELINKQDNYRPSCLLDDNYKIGYITLDILNMS